MQQLSLCLEQFTDKLHNKPYCTNNRYCIIFFCVLTIRCLGNGSVSTRLWNAIRSDDWAIPHVGLSSLGEIVGWARPDEFPPRNMRTSKGLRALGYNVRIGV